MEIIQSKEEIHICDYGCGQEGKYKIGKKWCCSKSQNSCPSKKERARINRVGVKNLPAQSIETDELCSFGCGQKAKFIYKNGSYCCKHDWHQCPGKHEQISKQSTLVWSDLNLRKRLSETQHKDLIAVAIPVLKDDNHVCHDCGEKANFWFKTNDRYCCCDRIERCPAVRIEISNRFIDLWDNDEFRQKMKESQIYDEARSLKISTGQKKWHINNPLESYKRAEALIRFTKDHTGETLEQKFGEEEGRRIRKVLSEKRLGKNYIELYGEEKARSTIETISKKLTGRIETRLEILKDMSIKKKIQWDDPNSTYNSIDFREKKSIESKERWKDPEYIKKIQQSLHNSPNGPERKLIELFNKLNLDYEFVGDWTLNIDGKNPDFINKKTNKLIEHFGVYYHDTIINISREEHEQQRIEHFAKEGYKCLIIWEDELKDLDKLIEKILKFDME